MKSIIWMAAIALAVGGVAGAANAQPGPDRMGDRDRMHDDRGMNRDGDMRRDRHDRRWSARHRHCTYRWVHHRKVRVCR